MKMHNFALVGEIGSGKDTVASFMPGYNKKAFGDNIKIVAKNLRINGVDATYCQLCALFKRKTPKDLVRKLHQMKELPKIDVKDRLLLQEIGTYCREQNDGIWVNDVMDKLSKDSNYVITDIRYPYEFDVVKKAGFTTVYIVSDQEDNIERVSLRDNCEKPTGFDHKAERSIPSLRGKCDIEIYNTGTIEDLKRFVNVLMNIDVNNIKPNFKIVIGRTQEQWFLVEEKDN